MVNTVKYNDTWTLAWRLCLAYGLVMQCVEAAEGIEVVRSGMEIQENAERRIAQLQSQSAGRAGREAQVRALYEIGQDPHLREVFADEIGRMVDDERVDVDIRAAGIDALAEVKTAGLQSSIERSLMQCLSHAEAAIKKAAIAAIVNRHEVTQATGDALLALLDDDNPGVQFQVLRVLENCPTLRYRVRDRLLSLLATQAVRWRSYTSDMAAQVPLAWDVARVIVTDCGGKNDPLRKEIEEIASETTDSRLKMILYCGLERDLPETSRALATVRENLRANAKESPLGVLAEIHENLLSPEGKLILLLEVIKGKGPNGHAAAFELIRRSDDWVGIRTELRNAVEDPDVPQWLKSAIDEWIANHPGLWDDKR